MNHNYRFADVNDALPALCRHLLNSTEVGSRLGDKTKEKTFVGITLNDPLNREILLPSRRANVAAQIAETMWVLSGQSDIGWLRNYLPRAEDFSDDGERWRGAYGPRLRAWGGWPHQSSEGLVGVDQLAHVVKLLSEEPSTRRAVMTIYDPTVDSAPGKDIPCNNWLSFLSRDGFLDLHVAIRSNDLIWGWSGINQFEWSALLEVVAGLTGLAPGRLHFSITSLHLYDRHYERAQAVSVDKALEPVKESPRFAPDDRSVSYLDGITKLWFNIEKALRANEGSLEMVAEFPEPMLRSWLFVIAYHWSKDRRYLMPLAGTGLYHAALVNEPKDKIAAEDASGYVKALSALHAEKNSAYGDSWKARGEMFSILPNIARKVDRLGTGKETADETTADTAADLLIYLLKYRLWLAENTNALFPPGTGGMAHVDQVARMIGQAPRDTGLPNAELVKRIREQFDAYLTGFDSKNPNRHLAVDALIHLAGPLAYRLWRPNAEPEERMHESGQRMMHEAEVRFGKLSAVGEIIRSGRWA